MTLILDVPPSLAERWETMPDEERQRRLPFLKDAIAKALDADPLLYLPPPDFAEAHRVTREARGDMRSAAEILRQDRDDADERREAVFRGEA